MASTLFTIGYERFTADAWLALVARNGIDLVVDVRDLPLSRKPGFSKRRLADALAGAGVGYMHARQLGNPKDLREALKHGMDWDIFARRFRSLINERTAALQEIASLAKTRSICLLCYEEDPQSCHRSLVAERLALMTTDETKVVHFRLADAA